jgi:hypothetical protein
MHGSNTFPKRIESVSGCKGRIPMILNCIFALKANKPMDLGVGTLMESQELSDNT